MPLEVTGVVVRMEIEPSFVGILAVGVVPFGVVVIVLSANADVVSM